jgi:hypothetical protein
LSDNSESSRRSRINSFILGAIIGGLCCFVLGAIFGNLQWYRNRFESESVAARKVIELKPQFSNLELFKSSNGTLQFVGTVPNQDARKELEASIIDQFGRIDLNVRLAGIKVGDAE